jgi:glycosyltransferase involved in cell wall biosynthesis
MKIAVVISARNEAQAIGEIVRAVPADLVHEVIVVGNGSTDNTVEQASSAGARIIFEPRPSNGSACLAGAKAAGRGQDTSLPPIHT